MKFLVLVLVAMKVSSQALTPAHCNDLKGLKSPFRGHGCMSKACSTHTCYFTNGSGGAPKPAEWKCPENTSLACMPPQGTFGICNCQCVSAAYPAGCVPF
ncbi:hypothetical protein BCR37DRAFT_382071 [Protomyces lactucae-debilis]|uniref:Uncharacterized protein n=1 Tax=Protomyces lactucae-debilis TaxID=2754530 RepID=A0A1Y2F5E1_PROLT|nr:uncharacterized protein BCR37DRAFT_382071 [Protomyces lactucae-debilis]ORY79079.1 hypothetical protein BCR37DRAFT_382071 [Protomyces lactucae-debilis]